MCDCDPKWQVTPCSSRTGISSRALSALTFDNLLPAVVADMWCGVVSKCPIEEGDMVTVGCYAQYDWLSKLFQYNPIVALNSSLQFDGYPQTMIGPEVQ